jgi:hypothetical protein
VMGGGQGTGDRPLTIDEGLLGSLPLKVSEAVRDLCQGDVLEARLPLTYLSGVAHPVWGPTADFLDLASDEGFRVIIHEGGEEPLRWVVTSQTCDIGKSNWPWIQVSPVFDMSGGGIQRVVNRKGPEYLWYLSASTDGIWVADLRVEVPIEKSLLVGIANRRGGQSEAEMNAFADRLGYLRSRAALSEDLVRTVQAPLRKALLGMQESPLFGVLDLGEVYLRTDSRLNPSWAQLVIIQDAADHAAITEWWDAKWESFSAQASAAGIELLRTEVTSPERVTLTEYRTLTRFPLSGLSEALPE